MTLHRWACAYLSLAAIMLSPLAAPASSLLSWTSPPPGPGGDPHAQHGTPKGWRLTWPNGDVAKGRTAFAKFQCYACHEVKGETFPAPREPGNIGPELNVMGPLHEVDYFAESVLNPGGVVETWQGLPGGRRFIQDAVVQRLDDGTGAHRSRGVPTGAEAAAGWPGSPRSLRLRHGSASC